MGRAKARKLLSQYKDSSRVGLISEEGRKKHKNPR